MSLLLLIASAWLIGNGLGKIVGYRPVRPTVPRGHFTVEQIEEAGRVALLFYSTRL